MEGGSMEFACLCVVARRQAKSADEWKWLEGDRRWQAEFRKGIRWFGCSPA
jgi:hypothetical protein